MVHFICSPYFSNQIACFFFPLYPLCTFWWWAPCTNQRIQASSPAKTALFSGVDGRLWSAEPSTCQAAEERKEKLVVLSLPAASFYLLPGIHTVHWTNFGPGPPLCFPRLTHSSRLECAPSPKIRPRLPNASVVGNAHPTLLSTLPPNSASPPTCPWVLSKPQAPLPPPNGRLFHYHSAQFTWALFIWPSSCDHSDSRLRSPPKKHLNRGLFLFG